MLKYLIGIGLGVVVASCSSSQPFWEYIVEGDVNKGLPDREQGTKAKPAALSPYNVKVVYNDGSTTTEVMIPILTSGQQVHIDHRAKGIKAQSVRVVPLPPTDADTTIEETYLKEGHPVKKEAPPVSIVKTHSMIRDLVRQGNYSLALEYADSLLKRYPNHGETLRIKGSLLVKMGEHKAALEIYRKAQEIDPNKRVEEQIEKLEKGLN